MTPPPPPQNIGSASRTEPGLVAELRRLLAADSSLADRLTDHRPGDILLHEGLPNDGLFVLLSGELELLKLPPDSPTPVPVTLLRAGDLLGVNSFVSGQPSFSTARATLPLRCLRLDASDLASLPDRHPELHRLLQRLIVANLGDRYRSSVQLQLHLQRTNRELTDTRNRLVHQEKMAVLGQLIAGVAHELNNPAAALLRQRDFLATALQPLLERAAPPGLWPAFWAAGLASPPSLGSADSRSRLASLEARHPSFPRTLLRRLASLPPDLASQLPLPPEPASTLSPDTTALLATFETAQLLRAQEIAARQVSHLVDSLRQTARPSAADEQPINLRRSLADVIALLGHLLKPLRLTTDLDPSLTLRGRPGDFHQIWTNLIKNACDAMQDSGALEITARPSPSDEAVITLTDHGPGIPPALRDRIFDVNFTTKTGAENFGLGLGLAITQSLVAQHGGRISLSDTPGGGATFTLVFPLAPV